MKVLLALLALVAVSQAAFTGTLQQRTQPLVDQMMFKMQLANTRSSRGLQDILMSLMGDHIANLQTAIAGHVANAHQQAQDMIQTVHETALSWGLNPQTVIGLLPDWLQNYVNGAVASRAGLSDILGAIQGHFQPHIDNALDQANQLAASLTLPNILNWLQGQLMSRGFFGDIWNSITGAVGNAWDSATNVASGMWNSATTQAMNMWQDFSTTATNVGSIAMSQVSDMASAFIADAQNNISGMTADAAIQFGNFMSQWKEELGDTFGEIQEQVANVVNNGNNAGRRF